MHHYLAAEALSGSPWLGMLPGEHMGTDAGREEREHESGMAGWASQLEAAPGPGTAEGLRVPAAEGWSRFKWPRCRLIRGTGELPGSGVRIPGTSGFGLAVEQGRELAGAAQAPCAALLTCFAQRGCR